MEQAQQIGQRRTRRFLKAENAQLKARLEAAKPDSRQGLKAKLAAARGEVKSVTTARDALAARVAALEAMYEPKAQPTAAQ